MDTPSTIPRGPGGWCLHLEDMRSLLYMRYLLSSSLSSGFSLLHLCLLFCLHSLNACSFCLQVLNGIVSTSHLPYPAPLFVPLTIQIALNCCKMLYCFVEHVPIIKIIQHQLQQQYIFGGYYCILQSITIACMLPVSYSASQ